MKPKTISIELDSDDVNTINDFIDLLMNIGYYAPDKRTIDIVSYLLAKWTHQNKSTGDSTIYIDQIVKKEGI